MRRGFVVLAIVFGLLGLSTTAQAMPDVPDDESPSITSVQIGPDLYCELDANPSGTPTEYWYYGGPVRKVGMHGKGEYICDRTPTALYNWTQLQYRSAPDKPWNWFGNKISSYIPRQRDAQYPWSSSCAKGYYRNIAYLEIWGPGGGHDSGLDRGPSTGYVDCLM